MTKFCIKCGKEIPQDSKKEKCERCQNKKYGVFRKIIMGLASLGALLLVIITKGKFGGSKNKL